MVIGGILLLLAQAAGGDTLQLSLEAAVDRAQEFNPTLRAERADARAVAQGPFEASGAFLPTLTLGLQGLRTTDPVAVFGFKLRHDSFTMDDFALDALNRPDPYGSFNSTATMTLPILAPEGLFGHAAASRAAAAREAASGRAAGAVTFFVTQAYWDAQLATRRMETLRIALEAARSHAAQAEALRDQGLVTGLDARLARVKAAEVETGLLAATAAAENALSALKTLLALPDDTPVMLTDSLAGRGVAVCDAADVQCDTGNRGDLDALRLGSDAAAAAVRSAWSKNLPSIAVFGSVAYYGEASPWGTGSGDWTVGFGVTWTPFAGLAGAGAVRRAKAEHEATLARREAAEREADLEVLRAARLLDAATKQVTVAEAADAEAQEASDQARLRYRTGTSSITELLDVQAAATATALSLIAARRDLYVAQAALDFAYGAYDR